MARRTGPLPYLGLGDHAPADPGRDRDPLLRTVDGGKAHALCAIYILREEPKVAKFKIVQRPDLSLEVQVNCRSSFDSTDRERITRRLQARIGPVGVQIRELDEIPLDRSGKHRYVQCLATWQAR